jgi:hypothetical protein
MRRTPAHRWLPGVMATEALAQLALALAPGYRVAASRMSR